MSADRTAWHPPFTTLLRERAPGWTKVTGELQLTQEPARADDCIEVRVDVARDPHDRGAVLCGLWPDVTCVALLEFKSVARPFRRGDLARLLAYGLTWFYAHQSHDALTLPGGVRRRARADDLTLALVVPTVTPTLLREIAQLRPLALTRREDGYHRLTGAFCAAIVVELEVAAAREHNELMAWFAGHRARLSVESSRWIRQNMSEVDTMDKASPELEGYDDWVQRYLDAMPLEERLAGLDPAELLAVVDPAQRLAGLDPAHQILALSDEVLRGMPDSYLLTLPDDVVAQIRARIGRPLATPTT